MAQTPAFAKSADYADWHSKDTIVTADNIAAAKLRYAAGEAKLAGSATPEQLALIDAVDADMQRINAQRK